MSATKYQVLARYYNTHTSNPIINDGNNKYQRVFKFYTTDNSEEIANVITEGNNPQNLKNDMLFIYNGTKKVYPTDGSVEYYENVKRLQKIIEDATQEKTQLENRKATLNTQMSSINNLISAKQNKITANTRSINNCTNDPVTCSAHAPLIAENTTLALEIQQLQLDLIPPTNEINDINIRINELTEIINNANNQILNKNGFYDPNNKWPYMIIDTYERVWFSPWFSVKVCGSLTDAIEKAKTLVQAIGIENIKIIKLVDIDQFVKIK